MRESVFIGCILPALSLIPFLQETDGAEPRLQGCANGCSVEIETQLKKLEQQVAELEKLLGALFDPHPAPPREGLISNLGKDAGSPEDLFRPTTSAPPPPKETRNPAENNGVTQPVDGRSFCARLRLKSKPVDSDKVSEAGPNILGVFTYEVLEVTRGGSVSSGTIQVAHGIRWGGEKTGVLSRPIGDEICLELVPLWWYPDLRSTEQIGERRNDRVALFTPRLHAHPQDCGR